MVAIASTLAWVAATPSRAAAAGTATGRVQFMQVVAHPDDDLFFMNPDIAEGIQTGSASVTVYVTASEISGNGSTPGQKARSLQRGVEDAYARMAGVPDVNPAAQEEWTGQAWTIGTRQVEKYWLIARPNVQLVFMNLHDANLGNVYDAGVTDTTVIPQGGFVSSSYSYNKNNVTNVLSSVITAYQPTVLRYQDTRPDTRYVGDHVDHYAAARFTRDASALYSGSFAEVTYRDYNIMEYPANLGTGPIAAKTSYWEDFEPWDDFAAPSNWLERQYYRWPRGTQWAVRNGSGRPQAFIVRNGVVSTMARAANGTWSSPLAIGNAAGAVVPTIAAITNNDGTVQVFARRAGDHHLITNKETSVGGAWGASWTDLGNPNVAFGNADMVGAPTVAANTDGRLWVFVKDGGGGVCAVRQNTNGTWSGWLDLGGGSDVMMDGLAATRGNDNRIELFASTPNGVLTFKQNASNGTTMVETGSLPMLPGVEVASPPSVTKNQDGTLEVIYREAGTTDFITTFQTGVGAGFNPTPVRIPSDGGIGQPALVTAPPTSDARIMIFGRNEGTGVSTAKQVAPDSPYGGFTDLGGTTVDYPTAVTDSSGAVSVFGIGIDAKLYVRSQSSAGANAAFQDWVLVG